MRRHLRLFTITLVLLPLMIGGLLIFRPFRTAIAQRSGPQPGGAQLSATAKQQIQALLAEKRSRTSAQKKIDSRLLYAMRERRGEAVTSRGELRSMRSAAAIAKSDEKGLAEVDIKGNVSKEMIKTIGRLGGEVLYASARAGAIRARVPFVALEGLATLPAVSSIRPAARAITHRRLTSPGGISWGQVPPLLKMGRSLQRGLGPEFDRRAANIRTQLSAVVSHPVQQGAAAGMGAATSEGVTAHRVIEARNLFGAKGLGIKIGVLSNSVDFLPQSIASGDLPPDVVVLPGQSGIRSDTPPDGEGTAMLEIIHDLAPSAKLYYATAFNGIDSFADNIRALRAAGCDIIVDDVIYDTESPFHDDIVTTAVNEVTADGALYFSSAGNDGNYSDGTSSAWEGDFRDSGTTLASLPGGTLHDFGNGVISNRVESTTGFILGLWWSDPLGASGNDYDIFILDNTLTTVLDASTNLQDGDDDPFEATYPGAFATERIIIFKTTESEIRALHLNNFGGELAFSTPGSTHGHNSAANAIGVAAIDVALADGGSFIGGPTNPLELFSSDGPRRVFYKSDGTPFTPGNILFSDGGGELRRKPDLTAADGVATTWPLFPTFFGTSAAAPHAAAIAALLKSAKPRLTSNEVREALSGTALDIEAPGFDQDSGAGIIDAFAALQFVGAAPAPFLELSAVATTEAGGDGDGFVEPGESGRLTTTLTNTGEATALGIQATLTTSTPGVTIINGYSGYPRIGPGGGYDINTTPFAFTLSNNAPCGLEIDFTLTVDYANSNAGPKVLTFKVQMGQLEMSTVRYTGPPVPIPDIDPAGVSIQIVVSGLSNPISDLNFIFDGSACTSDAGATTVGLDHTYVGDLLITLTSPQGTTVTLMNRPGNGLENAGHNFCNTMLDDGAIASIQNIVTAGAPYSGTFKPPNPLAAFNGQNGNGTWILNVADLEGNDTGNIRAFSLVFSTFSCMTSAP
jgi:subtilisin-like proprotein convertase family protein